MSSSSIRYGGGLFDLRTVFLKFCGFLQKKDIVIIDSNPKLCGDILGSSDVKGTFIEHLIAMSAWDPILSTESVDGEGWKNLSQKFKLILLKTKWRDRLPTLLSQYTSQLCSEMREHPKKIIDAEEISKITLRILYELLFGHVISKEDEVVFYQASVEWRKEIGMKGRADTKIKEAFWSRLSKIFDCSQFFHLLENEADRKIWLSAFAQPFLISPQINTSDILVAVFHYLRADKKNMDSAKDWAIKNDKARLNGILLESIRLQHPFPILEREFEKGKKVAGMTLKSKTQFFLILDQFQQDKTFNPERWLYSTADNPYHAIPFGVGPRMCMGKPIALELLTEILRVFLVDIEMERIQPQIGHIYSGRNNDHQTGLKGLKESFYQIKVIIRAVWKSWLLGRSQKRSFSTCPFHHPKIPAESGTAVRH